MTLIVLVLSDQTGPQSLDQRPDQGQVVTSVMETPQRQVLYLTSCFKIIFFVKTLTGLNVSLNVSLNLSLMSSKDQSHFLAPVQTEDGL